MKGGPEHGASASDGAAKDNQQGTWEKINVLDRDTSTRIARSFFYAATTLIPNDDNILPQEDGQTEKLSVYCLFSELFPECVSNTDCVAKTGLTRLQVQIHSCAWSLTVFFFKDLCAFYVPSHTKMTRHHAIDGLHVKHLFDFGPR
jgi:hypothetical protein